MAFPTSVSGAWPGTSEGEFDNYVGLFKEAYSDMIRLKAQTTESVLSDTLMPERLQGDPLNLDSYKGVSLTQRTRGRQFGVNSNNAATVGDQPYSQTPVERRTVVPQFWEYAELFDPRDERALMRAVRPDGQYAQNVVAAFNRKKDEVILDALIGEATINGTSYTSESATVNRSHLVGLRRDTDLAFNGSGGDSTGEDTNTGYDGDGSGVTGMLGSAGLGGLQNVEAMTQEILAGAGSTAEKNALHVKKLIVAQEYLQSIGMAAGTRVHCVLHPEQVGQLLSELQYTSADYNALRPLQAGQPVDFMGMSFRVCNQIVEESVVSAASASATTGITNTNGKYVYCYTDDCGVFGMTDDVTVRFDEIPERGYSLQCYHNFGLGGARMDPKKIVIIPCT